VKAIHDASHAIACDPGLAGARLVRGQARQLLGDREKAIADLKNARALSPSADEKQAIDAALKSLGVTDR
jgi:hypothetical protein